MKNLLTFIAILTLSSNALAQTCASGDCSCASCLAKKEGAFTLAGLEGLNAEEKNPHDDHSGCTHDHAPHKEPIAVPHDHDGDGVSDHASHEDHEDHADAAEVHNDLGGCTHDHATVDPHAGHDHGEDVEGGIELSEEMLEKIGIELTEATGRMVARTSVFPAEIKLNRDRTASISPRYVSIVRQVFAEIGDTVKRGDILAALENRETMAVYTVAASQDGVIISKDLAVGEIATEDHVLYQVSDLTSVWADINIFPQYLHQVHKNMTVELIAHDGHTADGTIKYISPIISEKTRTFTARCILQDAASDFTPGAFVQAKIQVDSVEASVAVPLDAVQTMEGESIVFIPSAHGFVTAPVKTGLKDRDWIEIKSGLNPGTIYVAKGAFALKAQMVTSGMDPHAGHGH